jgi:hypothetical protein
LVPESLSYIKKLKHYTFPCRREERGGEGTEGEEHIISSN